MDEMGRYLAPAPVCQECHPEEAMLRWPTKDLISSGRYTCPVAGSLTKKGDPSVDTNRLPQDDKQGAWCQYVRPCHETNKPGEAVGVVVLYGGKRYNAGSRSKTAEVVGVAGGWDGVLKRPPSRSTPCSTWARTPAQPAEA